MEMKVVIAAQPVELAMKSSSKCSTPYISAPSSPLNLFFYSAPNSPRSSSSSSYCNHHSNTLLGDSHDYASLLSHHQTVAPAAPDASSSTVPFNWELMPGVPRSQQQQQQREGAYKEAEGEYKSSNNDNHINDESFEFEFSGQLDMMIRPSLSSADELFDGGKIRPLKPPPRLLHINNSSDSPKSPKSPMSPIMSKFKDALSLSPKHRSPKHYFDQTDDPFEAALQTTSTDSHVTLDADRGRGRGRGRQDTPTNSKNGRKGISRSLSPLRVSEFALLHQQGEENEPPSSKLFSSSSRVASKKWRLKDLFLFRSASEGRATNCANRKNEENNNSSFRSSGGSGSVSRRRVKLSAHEMHYTAKRAVSEEQKKKTSLPYKHALLGCLGFNPVLQDLSKAFGSFAPS